MSLCLRAETADAVWKAVVSAFRDTDAWRVQESRMGRTRELPHVLLEIDSPEERWITSRRPALNPAFALAQVVWIVRGRSDAALPNYYFRGLPRFAGESACYPGAYGARLRRTNGLDQLEAAFAALKDNPTTRQVVLQIWTAEQDIPIDEGRPRSSDVPCNVISILKVRDGRLDWLQVSRSMDAFRGLPYNVVQFSYLQEMLAGWLGIRQGRLTYMCDSLHVYESDWSEFSHGEEESPASGGNRLVGTKGEIDEAFEELERRVDILVSESAPQSEYCDLASWDTDVTALRDVLAVLSAEAARRRGWAEEAEALMEKCTDSALKKMWRYWWSRVERRRGGGDASAKERTPSRT